MSAAAFNFLSNNIAPKWLTDKLADGGGGVGGGGEPTWNDDPRHRLSLNDEQGYGYGSTYNGAPSAVNRRSAPVQYQHRGSYGLQVVHDPQVYGSSAPEHPRHRRLSSPDPVLAHCANTIAVADFLMTLQRSLDGSSLTGGTTGAHHGLNRSAITGGGFGSVARHERRSPLFTLFQDRPRRASGESWQYSSLTSTLSSTSTAVSTATTLATDAGTINAVIILLYIYIYDSFETTLETLNNGEIKTVRNRLSKHVLKHSKRRDPGLYLPTVTITRTLVEFAYIILMIYIRTLKLERRI